MERTRLSNTQIHNLLEKGVLEGTAKGGKGHPREVYEDSLLAFVASRRDAPKRRSRVPGDAPVTLASLSQRVDQLAATVVELRDSQQERQPDAAPADSSYADDKTTAELATMQQRLSDLEWASAKDNEATDKLRAAALVERQWRQKATELQSLTGQLVDMYADAESLRQAAGDPLRTDTPRL